MFGRRIRRLIPAVNPDIELSYQLEDWEEENWLQFFQSDLVLSASLLYEIEWLKSSDYIERDHRVRELGRGKGWEISSMDEYLWREIIREYTLLATVCVLSDGALEKFFRAFGQMEQQLVLFENKYQRE